MKSSSNRPNYLTTPRPAGRGRRVTILTAIFALLLVVAFGWLTSGRAVTRWDAGVVDRLAGERTAWLTGRMIGLSVLGGWMAIPIALAVTLLLARLRQGRAAACYSVTTLSGWALNAILKVMFHRPRPLVLPSLGGAGWYSYPSGHAMLAPLVFGLGAIFLARRAGPIGAAVTRTVGIGLTLAIAFSRVYLGVHYPSDVIGALVAGSAWAVLGVTFWRPFAISVI